MMYRYFQFLILFSVNTLSTCEVDSNHHKQPSTVFWMHIQKTSSWLGDFLLMWGCSQVRNINSKSVMAYAKLRHNMSALQCEAPFYTGRFPFGYHVPVNVEMNRTAVTLFRNPYNRVISAFLFGRGNHQIMFPVGFAKRAYRDTALREEINKSDSPIVTYASLPGIAS